MLAASCGGSGGKEQAGPESAVEESTGVGALPDWVRDRVGAEQAGALGLIFGTADHAPGPNRVSFVVVRADESLVQAPEADVYYGLARAKLPSKAKARLFPLGPHTHPPGTKPHDHPDVTDLYVARVAFPRAGRYWFVVEPEGESKAAAALLDVRKETFSPRVGAKAVSSDNPTLADAPAAKITTARPPDRPLLRYSVAGSLRDRAPFVVVFATPLYCQSRTCGPVVDVVDAVRKRLAGSPVRFIHIEVYEGNDPKQGLNRWMKEWLLPTEPWVFLVDRRGVIRAKFEGAVSVEEVEAAVRRYLV